MRVWIREASVGVMWIVPGAELGDIVMSLLDFLFCCFWSWSGSVGSDGYVVLFLVLLPLYPFLPS
jgi:hypothetical protein